MHMATNNPKKFAAILIEKLKQVIGIENQAPQSSNILETSFTDTGKIITSEKSSNTFKRPKVPLSNKEARVQRVSECCEFCKTKDGKENTIKMTTFRTNNHIENNNYAYRKDDISGFNLNVLQNLVLGVDTSQYITQTNQLDDLKSKLIIEAESEDTSFTEETVIIYEITSDRHPYKIKVPTNRMTMTLQQFKSCLGSSVRTKIAQNELGARFFFKTYDKDIDGALFVELVNDSDIVPLFESRIHAKIDPM